MQLTHGLCLGLSEVHIWLDRNDRVTKLVADGEVIDKKVRFKIVFNYWMRDIITIHKWDNGYKNDVSFKALFVVVFTTG